jgi:hypothetical protein
MEDSNSLKQNHESDDSSLDPSFSSVQSPASVASSKSSLAGNETRAVNRSKMLVHFALLLAGVAVGAATYFFVAHQEEENFEVDVSKRLRAWQKHGRHYLVNHSSHGILLFR